MSEESKRKSQVLLDPWAKPLGRREWWLLFGLVWGWRTGAWSLWQLKGALSCLGKESDLGLWWRCMICIRSGIGMWEQVLGLFKVWGGAQKSQVPPQSTSSYVGTMHFQLSLQPWQAPGPGKGWTEILIGRSLAESLTGGSLWMLSWRYLLSWEVSCGGQGDQ